MAVYSPNLLHIYVKQCCHCFLPRQSYATKLVQPDYTLCSSEIVITGIARKCGKPLRSLLLSCSSIPWQAVLAQHTAQLVTSGSS